jgi:hypothetical protein
MLGQTYGTTPAGLLLLYVSYLILYVNDKARAVVPGPYFEVGRTDNTSDIET